MCERDTSIPHYFIFSMLCIFIVYVNIMKKLDKLFKNQEKIQESVKNILDIIHKDLSDDNSDCVTPPY